MLYRKMFSFKKYLQCSVYVVANKGTRVVSLPLDIEGFKSIVEPLYKWAVLLLEAILNRQLQVTDLLFLLKLLFMLVDYLLLDMIRALPAERWSVQQIVPLPSMSACALSPRYSGTGV